MSIKLNLEMKELGDTINYRLIIYNNSNEDYEFSQELLNVSSDYINYKLLSVDNVYIVSANNTKDFILSIEYKNEVPEALFSTGVYSDKNIISIDLSNGDLDAIEYNPKTRNNIFKYILLVLIVVIFSIVLYKKKYKKILSLFLLLLLPISVAALLKVQIIIDSNIDIVKKPMLYSFTVMEDNEDTDLHFETTTYQFEEGMTWGDWLNSDYNTGLPLVSSNVSQIRLSYDHFIYESYDNDEYFLEYSDVENLIGGCGGYKYLFDDNYIKVKEDYLIIADEQYHLHMEASIC